MKKHIQKLVFTFLFERKKHSLQIVIFKCYMKKTIQTWAFYVYFKKNIGQCQDLDYKFEHT